MLYRTERKREKMNITKLSPTTAKDLIGLVNDLKSLPRNGKMGYSTKGGGNVEFRYVELRDIMEKIKEFPTFAFMQPLGTDNTKPCLQCLLVHESGEFILSDPYELKFKDNSSSQDQGAIITYTRRYSASSFFGISDDDTDGKNPAEELEKEEAAKAEKLAKEKAKVQTDITQLWQTLVTKFGKNEAVYEQLGLNKTQFMDKYNNTPSDLLKKMKDVK